jgi:hypothetical protein
MEVELFHADGQRDMTKILFAFCNFAKAFKNFNLFKKHLYYQT